MKNLFKVYGAMLATVVVMDGLWLGVIAIGWYKEGIGHLMGSTVFIPPALAFYVLYPAAIFWFMRFSGLLGQPISGLTGSGLKRAALLGAMIGATSYGVYDLTNWATLTNWPWWITAMDWAWGILVSACCAMIGFKASGQKS